MFAELLAQPGVTELLELRSDFGFLAFHGGSLEQHTDAIAAAAARAGGASLYAVAQPPDLHWHIPSRLVGPDASPRLATFLHHVRHVIAIHGYGREGRWTDVLLGGSDRGLAARLAPVLRGALPEYEVIEELRDIPPELRGLHPDNPVNRVRSGGVQLELPPRIRGLGPVWADWKGPEPAPPTQALIAALARFATSEGAV
jgi:phage replication-related protein YjqB (UPF0714/DUF867 family)